MARARDTAGRGGFGAVVAEHHAEIRRYLGRLTARASEAEDLTQETFLRACRAWVRLAADADARAWLYAIATNAYRNHVRSERRRHVAHAGVRVVRRNVEIGDPETETSAGEIRRLAEAAIRSLPIKQRLAFTMRKLEELDYEVIGESLACTPETARAHVFQALRKIRTTLDGHLSRSKRSKK